MQNACARACEAPRPRWAWGMMNPPLQFCRVNSASWCARLGEAGRDLGQDSGQDLGIGSGQGQYMVQEHQSKGVIGRSRKHNSKGEGLRLKARMMKIPPLSVYSQDLGQMWSVYKIEIDRVPLIADSDRRWKACKRKTHMARSTWVIGFTAPQPMNNRRTG